MTSLLKVLANMNLSATETLNSCGKAIYEVSDITFLKRFLFLGAENGTYYITNNDLVNQHVKCIEKLINNENNHKLLLDTIDEYVNKAFKKDYVLLALARCCVEQKYPALRDEAYKLVNKVCKIPTHLFLFIEFYEILSKKHYNSTGWNKKHKQFIAHWYLTKDPRNLLYLVTKYQNRNNWKHRDVLRLSHIKASGSIYDYIFKYITTDLETFNAKCKDAQNKPENISEITEYIVDYENIKTYTTFDENVLALIEKQQFVREHLSTQILDNVQVWNALCKKMPFTAMLKTLNKITKIGLFEKYPETLNTLIEKLNSKEAITKSNVHPLQILIALKTYSTGSGFKGTLSWTPNRTLCNALNDSFKLSFSNVKPTNKRYSIALDVSGSMGCCSVAGIECMNARELSVAFAMILRDIELKCEINGFSSKFIPLDISPLASLEKNIDSVSGLPFNNTDCSIPMMNAIENDKKVDVFIIITDSETNCNRIKPSEALKRYREHSGIKNAKLIVVAMAANKFTLADPNDPNMLDIVGFSESTYDAIQEFVML